MSQKKESDSEIIKRLIKERHRDTWLVEYASIGQKLKTSEYGAFTRKGLTTYTLSPEKQLIKTGEIYWPIEKHGEVDHFAFKSHFTIDGVEFVTGNHGKEVQKFLEGEKKDSFTKLIRPFYQKIIGFRSKKRWKQITAVIGYLFIIFFFIGLFIGDDEEKETVVVKSTTAETQKNTEEADEKQAEIDQRKKEEAALLEEEKQKKEAEEKRLAEEQKKKEEARLAEEQRKRDEEARLAEEQRQQEANINVSYKNCDAVRAAGAAPIHKGEPGYAKHLDRDGDGIGCDR